jgi:hypothetical protein
MQFNRYILDLYLQSPEGKQSLKIWTEVLNWEKWNGLDFEILLKLVNSSLLLDKDEVYLKEIFNTTRTEILQPFLEGLKNSTNKNIKKITWADLQKEIDNKFGFTTDKELVEDAKEFWQEELENIILGDKQDREYTRYIDIYSTYLTILT